MLETKNKSLSEDVARLKDELITAQSVRTEAEREVKKLQAELADMHRKLATAETRLEIQEKVGRQRDRMGIETGGIEIGGHSDRRGIETGGIEIGGS